MYSAYKDYYLRRCIGLPFQIVKREETSFTERFSIQVFLWALMENKGINVSV